MFYISQKGVLAMPNPAILFYSPAPMPYAPKLRQLCAVQGIRLRVAETGDLGRPLSALAQGLHSAEALNAGEALPEPLLVFCHFSDKQLDRALLSLRRIQVFCLKAVLTPANAEWTLRELYGELCKERSQLGSAHPPKG